MIDIVYALSGKQNAQQLIKSCCEQENSCVVVLKTAREFIKIEISPQDIAKLRVYTDHEMLCGIQMTTIFITQEKFKILSEQDIMLLLSRLRKPNYKGKFACYVIDSSDCK